MQQHWHKHKHIQIWRELLLQRFQPESAHMRGRGMRRIYMRLCWLERQCVGIQLLQPVFVHIRLKRRFMRIKRHLLLQRQMHTGWLYLGKRGMQLSKLQLRHWYHYRRVMPDKRGVREQRKNNTREQHCCEFNIMRMFNFMANLLRYWLLLQGYKWCFK